MVTLTPARILGIQNRTGSLAPGKDADLAILDADFNAWRTMIGGQWVAAIPRDGFGPDFDQFKTLV